MEELFTLIDKFWKTKNGRMEHSRLQTLLREKEPDLREHLYTSFKSQLDIKNSREENSVDYVKVLMRIHSQAGINKTVPETRSSLRVIKNLGLAAASVMLVLGLTVLFKRTEIEKLDNRTAKVTQLEPTVITNRSKQPKKVKLHDGSEVVLSSNTTLRFDHGFNITHRMLVLEGEANFKVKKNQKIPFVVLSNGYSTTALGTEFTINNKASDNIKLMLISGKIVVRSTENSVFKIMDTYMRKGDEFFINIRDKSSKLNEASRNQPKASAITKSPIQRDQDIYRFENSKLPDLFDQLKKRTNKSIVFREADLIGMTFTGEFKKTDSIQFILRVICHTNELSIREEGDKIIIGNQ